MGRDANTSVLNRWNQAWDAPNLFVTDGPCMTSSGCQNPSLTYMALTARACHYAVGLSAVLVAAGARDSEGGQRAILASSDGHIRDGHHQRPQAMTDRESISVTIVGTTRGRQATDGQGESDERMSHGRPPRQGSARVRTA